VWCRTEPMRLMTEERIRHAIPAGR